MSFCKTVALPKKRPEPTIWRKPRKPEKAVGEFVEAVNSGSLALVKRLLAPSLVNGRFDTAKILGITPLMVASANRDRQMVGLLLQNGANVAMGDISHFGDPKVDNWGGSTCLHYAIEGGSEGHSDNNLERVQPVDLGLVQDLVEAGADVNAYTGRGVTVLESGVKCASGDVVRFLLAKGANPNMRVSGDYGAMHWAIEFGKSEIVDLLLEHGYDVGVIGDTGGLLHVACLDERPEMIPILSKYKCPVDLRDNKGRTALFSAIAVEDLEAVQELLRLDKSLLGRSDAAGQKPIEWAKHIGNKKILDYLKSQGSGQKEPPTTKPKRTKSSR